MHASRLTSFFLWAITSFFLIATFLKYEPIKTQQALPPISTPPEISFSAADIEYLFQTSTPASTTPVETKASSSLNLKGIVYSSVPGQSRALIEASPGKVVQYAQGRQLPNGAELIQIDRRSITYQLDGQQHQVLLPKRP